MLLALSRLVEKKNGLVTVSKKHRLVVGHEHAIKEHATKANQGFTIPSLHCYTEKNY